VLDDSILYDQIQGRGLKVAKKCDFKSHLFHWYNQKTNGEL